MLFITQPCRYIKLSETSEQKPPKEEELFYIYRNAWRKIRFSAARFSQRQYGYVSPKGRTENKQRFVTRLPETNHVSINRASCNSIYPCRCREKIRRQPNATLIQTKTLTFFIPFFSLLHFW